MYRYNILILICISVFTQSFSQVLTPTFRNVNYSIDNNDYHKLDIYIPPGLTSPAPVVVFIHGGGWNSGSKGPENIPFFKQSYDSGFICVDINYRLSTDSVWPAQIEDCKTAIRFLRANAKTYNIDNCRFGVIGESAGGHLASLLGTSAGIISLEGSHLGYANQSSRVQAVINLYGPTNFLKEDGFYPATCEDGGFIHEYSSFETELLGIDRLHNYPSLVRSADPSFYITSDDARFFIIHGAADCIVPPYQSIILDSVLLAANIPADTLYIAAGQNHGNPFFRDYIRTGLYNRFFLKHLSVPCPPVGISEEIEQRITVFPNPATTEIEIDLPAINLTSVEVIDNMGKVMLNVKQQNILDISALRKGIYYLRISYDDRIYTQKIIKL